MACFVLGDRIKQCSLNDSIDILGLFLLFQDSVFNSKALKLEQHCKLLCITTIKFFVILELRFELPSILFLLCLNHIHCGFLKNLLWVFEVDISRFGQLELFLFVVSGFDDS